MTIVRELVRLTVAISGQNLKSLQPLKSKLPKLSFCATSKPKFQNFWPGAKADNPLIPSGLPS